MKIKYLKSMSVILLLMLSAGLYHHIKTKFVATGAKKFEKLQKKAVALIEDIAQNAAWGILPDLKKIKELRKLTPYIPKNYKGKNYEALTKALRNIPNDVLKKDPEKTPEAQKYMQPDLSVEDVAEKKADPKKKTSKKL
ncbi:hypothetical protein ACFLYU_00940 [Candidatus Dependentiae bacterium]